MNITEGNRDDITRIDVPELSQKDEGDNVGQADDDEQTDGKGDEGDEEKEDEEEGKEGEDEEEEYEGEDNDDEYEDELRAVAESHEVMSRDKLRNSNTSSVENEQLDRKFSTIKNFDSHEEIDENMSSEDVASNEAIISSEVVEKPKEKAEDKEVTNIHLFSLNFLIYPNERGILKFV